MSKYTITSIAFLAATTCSFMQLSAEEMHQQQSGRDSEHRVPPAQPLGKDDNLSMFIGASYTYWLPYSTGIAVAFGEGTATERGNTLSAPTYGNSGFKVTAGANMDHDGWHARATYTWFLQNNSARTANNVSSNYQYEIWGVAEATINQLDQRWYVYFNRVDAFINRNYYIGDYVVFRPWLGLLGAWDTQILTAENNNTGNLGTVEIDNKIKQNWWGVGPYAGGEATYCFTKNFGLFIQSGAALLYAQHNATTDANSPDTSLGFLEANVYNVFNVEPMLEAMLGVRWESMWNDFAVRIDVAWELQTYLEHMSFPVYRTIVQNFSNYSMQGATVSARLSF